MIFVSLGTHERPFLRLVKEIDRLSIEGSIKGKIIVQLGFTDYKFKSRNIEAEKYMEQKKFDSLFNKAGLIITHGGSGNILEAVSQGKPVIAVPRLAKFGEHVNDHQLQIVKEMEKLGGVIAVYDIGGLADAIRKAETSQTKKIKGAKPGIFSIIENALEEWDRTKTEFSAEPKTRRVFVPMKKEHSYKKDKYKFFSCLTEQ